ncbi:glycosyltransferase [Bacillus sp. NPDC077027]|uniref:glycosyltransferase n=1 Tax=Bacillus sp. NPDC077027 TaxID=3390548 RepID=UPI003D068FFB
MNGKTSIVILTYNELHLTKQCLQSIKQHTPENEIELIIVDNASTDGTKEYLEQLSEATVIYNQKNLGFAKGCNQGAKVATGDSILFLNNDTMVTENWLPPLRTALYQSKQVGMVGPVSNYVSGPQMVQPSYDHIDQLSSFAKQYTDAMRGQVKNVLRLVGFCLLVKREVVEDVGLFDERFVYGSFEDDDLCVRALLKGYQLQIVYDSFVHHHGHATFRANQETNISTLFAENRVRFLEKWGIDLNLVANPQHHILGLVPHEAKRILDVGCGAGATGLELMHRQGAAVYGVEVDSLKAKMARAYYQDVIEGDGEQNTWEDKEAFFDAILFSDVLEHMKDPWQAVSRWQKCLKPGGWIVCCLPNVTHAEALLPLVMGEFPYRDAGILDRTHLRFFTPKSLPELFPKELFEMIRQDNIVVSVDKKVQLFFDEITRLGESLGFSIRHMSDQINIYQMLLVVRKKGDSS